MSENTPVAEGPAGALADLLAWQRIGKLLKAKGTCTLTIGSVAYEIPTGGTVDPLQIERDLQDSGAAIIPTPGLLVNGVAVSEVKLGV